LLAYHQPLRNTIAIPKPINVYIDCLSRLDPALIRPGRVDVKISIDYATEYQLAQMYQRFYPEQPLEKSLEFARKVVALKRNVSMAQVQGYFMFYKLEPMAALENSDKLCSL